MKCNVGGLDRGLRFAVGTGALTAGLFAPLRTPWRLAAFALAAGNLFAATTRYCPMNAAFGIDTCHAKARLPGTRRQAQPVEQDVGDEVAPAAAI